MTRLTNSNLFGCVGAHDDGIADGNLTRCSVISGCGLDGCPYELTLKAKRAAETQPLRVKAHAGVTPNDSVVANRRVDDWYSIPVVESISSAADLAESFLAGGDSLQFHAETTHRIARGLVAARNATKALQSRVAELEGELRGAGVRMAELRKRIAELEWDRSAPNEPVSDPLHRWSRPSDSDVNADSGASRLRVPGGWVYSLYRDGRHGMVFVPEPKP